jgi:hypothetical protein
MNEYYFCRHITGTEDSSMFVADLGHHDQHSGFPNNPDITGGATILSFLLEHLYTEQQRTIFFILLKIFTILKYV